MRSAAHPLRRDRHPRVRAFDRSRRSTLGWALSSVLILTACGGGGDGVSVLDDQGGGGGVVAFDPASPGERFTRNSDGIVANEQIDRMWRTMTAATCWDASFVGDPTLAGTPAGVSQFQFYDQNQFRHVGFSTNFGSVYLHDVGYHDGHDTAIVETWTGDVEALIVIDGSTLAHVLKNPAGVPFVSYYGASSQGCL